jgi:hypothetical protein
LKASGLFVSLVEVGAEALAAVVDAPLYVLVELCGEGGVACVEVLEEGAGGGGVGAEGGDAVAEGRERQFISSGKGKERQDGLVLCEI